MDGVSVLCSELEGQAAMDGDGLGGIFLHVPFVGTVLACWSGYGHKVRSLAVVPLLATGEPVRSKTVRSCDMKEKAKKKERK